MSQNCKVAIKSFSLPADLQRYFSALYSFDVTVPEGLSVDDCHYPDWAGLHFTASGKPPNVSIGGMPATPGYEFTANGPTSRALNVQMHTSRSWSVGLSPVAWARYVEGSANKIANSVVDGSTHPAFVRVVPILELVREDPDDIDGTARRIEEFLCDIRPRRRSHEEQVISLNTALRDPDVGDVEALVKRIGVSRRTIERLAARYFGFSPKLLLRRQRFVRSLGKFTIKPGRSWSASLDAQYVDQAHFVRDFRSFMGMTPSEYAQMSHPILEGIFTRRLVEQGAEPA